MSLSPEKYAFNFDLFNGTGTGITSTGASPAVKLPPGKKAIQVTMPTTSTVTIKVQNSVDGVTFFDVSSSTGPSTSPYLAEVDSVIPYWRAHVTSYAWMGAGTAVAVIAQQIPSN